MELLKPMHWPKPVPLVMWQGDYADIRDHCRRYGYLEVAEDLSFACDERYGRHSFPALYDGVTYRRVRQPRLPTLAERLQAEHEADAYRRQRAKEEQADREWQAAEKARREQARAEAKAAAENDIEAVRKRQAALQAARQAMAKARADAERLHDEIHETVRYWAAIDPNYGSMTYHRIAIATSGVINGVQFHAGRTYLVPRAVAQRITGRAP